MREKSVAFHFEQFTFDKDFDPSKKNSHTRIDFRIWLFSLLHPCLAAAQCQYCFDTVLLDAPFGRPFLCSSAEAVQTSC